MALGAGERVRYARQLLLTELREEAHERVLETRLSVADGAAPRARAVLEDYAARAGLGARASAAHTLRVHMPSEAELAHLAGPSERCPAVAALAGALVAADALLRAAGVEAPADPASQLSVVSEDVW